ncbi:DegT/DnrJ/EryC1/StrS family aminotransferase [Cognatiyoonia sp. IB215182]|uniref:DegT/DnrJ/EryC1/StrS family aminotransferase n=1 Tax=Cognatiyoonia sp. IB215182 TaxID=3097353 RepID=UPI002A14F7DF|nr:DegT/DnrJ/EryC1/StrS family aminotransferase [Cognatiyoonia sp. IB215182]MDX8354715.1 DegT/DnrJ/EryC1/StrS family aminotransferase [Cognatiyoonia sp. IB215182]
MVTEFLNLGAAYKELQLDIDAAVSRVMNSGWFILGEEVARFEKAFAAYCEAQHAVGVANGLDALILSLRALDIGLGDEVIVPSNTYIATWLAVSEVGASVVPVEPDPQTHNIDPARIETAITPRTRAVIAVHLYGQPVDLDPILTLTRTHRIALIEDAAQAHGARYRGQRIGSHGDLVCWSFYPAKNLGAMGDAGSVTTNNSVLAERVRMLGNYGGRRKYHNEILGLNSRLDEIQAAILSVKLPHMDDWNERRRLIAKQYSEAFAGTDLGLPTQPDYAECVWHLYVVRCPDRAGLVAHLDAAGVRTQMHYPIAPAEQPAYAVEAKELRDLPIARALAANVLSLPIGPHQSQTDTDRVIDAVCRYST